MTHIRGWTAIAAAALAFVATTNSPALADDPNDAISQSQVQQGLAASPIPPDKLNLKGKNPYLVALGSYLVNGAGDCNGCHSFPRFLRPGGTVPGTNGNATGNLTSQGSNPQYGNPYLDPPDQSVTAQLKANTNVKHFLANFSEFGVVVTTPIVCALEELVFLGSFNPGDHRPSPVVMRRCTSAWEPTDRG